MHQQSFHRKVVSGQDGDLSPDQLQRLELLKLQKELQRREKEREDWHNAATPRNAFTSQPGKKGAAKPSEHQSKGGRSESEFFSKLRRGKFLE